MFGPGNGPSRLRVRLGLLLTLCLALSAAARGVAEDELPKPRAADPKKDKLSGPEILPPSYPDGLGPAMPLTFLDTLRLGVLGNLDIVQARLAIQRAQARALRTQTIYLPNLSIGATYVAHDGMLQNTAGNLVEVNRDSLFIGGGPTFSLGLSDAIFLPSEFRSLVTASNIAQVRITNEVLLQVADAYFNVLRARRRLARLDEVLDFLTSEEESELRGGSKGLLPLIRAFVEAGTALPSDQARVEADVVRRMEERVRALQDVRVASAELARLLHLPGLFFIPAEDYRWPLKIPGEPWLYQPVEALVTQGLRSRPELAENRALLDAAVTRYRNAYWRPILPQLAVNYSYGAFTGGPGVIGRTASGSNVLGNSRTLTDLGTRGDFDISLTWRLQGLGVGNHAEQWEARVRIEQNQVRQMFLHDQVVTQVVQAAESVRRGYERVSIVRPSLFDEKGAPTGAIYRSLRLNFLRIKGGQGLPLEVLDSTRRLSDVLEGYVLALTDYDQARFRMLFALGMPPEGLVHPELLPMPPGPPARPQGQPAPAPKPKKDKPADEKNGEEGKDVDELPLPGKRKMDEDKKGDLPAAAVPRAEPRPVRLLPADEGRGAVLPPIKNP